jgi:hypothetical protein
MDERPHQIIFKLPLPFPGRKGAPKARQRHEVENIDKSQLTPADAQY